MCKGGYFGLKERRKRQQKRWAVEDFSIRQRRPNARAKVRDVHRPRRASQAAGPSCCALIRLIPRSTPNGKYESQPLGSATPKNKVLYCTIPTVGALQTLA
ncbi:hypothetical protein N656DRAFT_458648 [Canariomyces notabilis]|uniref:Uncharacterized protein n=1 Tax=Canariomyces notabilis TaxID=2074819 RepID=A0AAN6QD56_9PEZI|nr:hypothetical protein N656DRAFT_458648 [Canariomyces arenarius]